MNVSIQDRIDSLAAWEARPGALDIRVGTVVQAEQEAGAVRLWINFGPEFGQRRSSLRLSSRYDLQGLVGSQVCAVVNPRPHGAAFDEVLTLGMTDHVGEIVLIRPDQRVADGGKLF